MAKKKEKTIKQLAKELQEAVSSFYEVIDNGDSIKIVAKDGYYGCSLIMNYLIPFCKKNKRIMDFNSKTNSILLHKLHI